MLFSGIVAAPSCRPSPTRLALSSPNVGSLSRFFRLYVRPTDPPVANGYVQSQSVLVFPFVAVSRGFLGKQAGSLPAGPITHP